MTEIRPDTNEVVIGEPEELMTTVVRACDVNWMAIEKLTEPMRVTAKIRYAHQGASALIRMIDAHTVEAVFDEPQRAATPGQGLVFYHDDMVIGGGTICR